MERISAVRCSKVNSSKSQTSGAGKFTDPMLMPEFVTVLEILCA